MVFSSCSFNAQAQNGGSRKRSALAVREVEVKEDVKMQKIQLAQGFLANAKAALGPDKFAVFQQSLRKYKAKDITIQRVICDCLPVFLSVSDAALRADLLKVKQKNFANKKKKFHLCLYFSFARGLRRSFLPSIMQSFSRLCWTCKRLKRRW